MWHLKIKPFRKDYKDPDDIKPIVLRKNCAIADCPHLGEYRAPKSRYDLNNYYWFCLDHVREYNANWDFFKGMNRVEIEQHMYKTMVWDRPTWKSTLAGSTPDRLREKIYAHFTSDGVFGDFTMAGDVEDDETQEAQIDAESIPHPTMEALTVMELTPPVKWEQIRLRYKNLAKRYHPDTNKGDKEAEEQFKKISLAYTILRISYQNFSALDK